MNRNKIQMMVKGAMLASLFGVLGMINIYTGTMFDVIFTYVMVVGIVYYTLQYDYQAALSVVFVTGVVLFMVGEMFFTIFSCLTLLLGVFYGACQKRHKNNQFIKWGLMLLSALKNAIIFFMLGKLLGMDPYQEGLEMYQEIIAIIPIIKNVINPTITYAVMWILMVIGESYIVRWYSDVFVLRMKKNKMLK